MYVHSYESTALVAAMASELFDHIDDHVRLSSHMSKPSWMMAGGSMTVDSDSGGGKAVGSRLTLNGNILGTKLKVEEQVTERNPPYRKVWETVGQPNLLIIGSYQMGFEIKPVDQLLLLRVFINYSLPTMWWQRWLGVLFAKSYARWCTTRMADDAARHFTTHTNLPPIHTATK